PFRRRQQEPSGLSGAEKWQAKRKQEQRQRALSGLQLRLRDRAKLIGTAFIIVMVLLAAGSALFYLHQQGTFVLEDITISGNSQISDLTVIAELEYLKGRGMFSFSTAEVEDKLLTAFPYLRSVYARKKLPGELEVEVVERFPVMSYINLSGVYLIDEESVVVGQLASQEVTALTNSERLIVDGFGDINAEYVYEKYLAGIDNEEERKNVKWEEVPEDQKQAALAGLRDELDIRVNNLINNNLEILSASQFADLPRVQALDAEQWQVGRPMAEDRYQYSIAIINYFADTGVTVVKLLWQSDFTAVAHLTDGRQVIFTSTTSIDEQISKLEVVRSQVDLNGVSVIDLRGEFVAVK
ncbi:FtsQ-type POTRA domain-containing protein, partial [Candidatus Dojkabacteria bacterium]|nr:FtsQ-type POTRA domain-containing protein [Candidatus Dojkabacteria bacterium]